MRFVIGVATCVSIVFIVLALTGCETNVPVFKNPEEQGSGHMV